jgi:hypothetical protein
VKAGGQPRALLCMLLMSEVSRTTTAIPWLPARSLVNTLTALSWLTKEIQQNYRLRELTQYSDLLPARWHAFNSQQRQHFIFTTVSTLPLWGPSSLLFKRRYSSRVMMLPTHLHLLQVRNAWSYTFTPSHIFKAWFLNKCRENLNFTRQHTRITLSKIMNWKLNSKCLIPGTKLRIFSLISKRLSRLFQEG